MNRWMIGSGLVLVLVAAGCGREERREPEVGDRVDRIREEIADGAEDAVDAVRTWAFTQQDDLEGRLDDLAGRIGERIDELRDETGDEAERLRGALEERRSAIQQAVADIGEATEERWAEARDAAVEAMEDARDWLDRPAE